MCNMVWVRAVDTGKESKRPCYESRGSPAPGCTKRFGSLLLQMPPTKKGEEQPSFPGGVSLAYLKITTHITKSLACQRAPGGSGEFTCINKKVCTPIALQSRVHRAHHGLPSYVAKKDKTMRAAFIKLGLETSMKKLKDYWCNSPGTKGCRFCHGYDGSSENWCNSDRAIRTVEDRGHLPFTDIDAALHKGVPVNVTDHTVDLGLGRSLGQKWKLSQEAWLFIQNAMTDTCASS